MANNGDTKKCVTGWSVLMAQFVLPITLIEFSRGLFSRGQGLSKVILSSSKS